MKSNLKVFLLLAVVFLSSSSAALAQLAGWSHKVPLQIDENKGESVPYQIMFVELNTAALVSAGQMQANGDDIRFAIDCDASQLVPYWIEAGMNTATTKIWLRLPAIAANTSVYVWLFTGNPGAAPGSSNSSVFQTTFATSGNFTLPVGTYDYDDFRVNAGDTLFVLGDGIGTNLRINSGYMLVEGVIMANGQGFPGGLISNGFGPGAGSSSSNSGAGGGGHGGVGGTGAYDTGDPINAGGITYGALGVSTGTEAGSGGGGYDVLGGSGGGGVWLQTYEFEGTGGQVWVDGLNGIGDGQSSGGGSGGGALVVADVVDFTAPAFTISANGGDGGIGTIPSNDDGGSGAGGIAKVYYYDNVTSSFVLTALPGIVGTNGDIDATQGGNGLTEISGVPGAFTYNLGAAITASDLNIISGDDAACQSSIVQYVASTISGYNNSWSVLSGGNIVSGVGSNAVEVEWTTIGTHLLVAYATDPVSGCELTDTLSVTVSNTTVTTTITYTENCAGTPTAFSTSVAYNAADTYSWDFGDGASSTDFNPTHIFAAAGSYPVTLTITTASGCSMVSNETVVVPAEPTADFTFTTTTCPGEAVAFTNASADATSYSWDFGDGATSTATDPSHTYAGPGTYTVTLTAISTADCDATISKSVTVSTTAGADFDFTSACPGDAVSFTDQSNIGGGTIDSLLWSFGDGNTATGATPTNTYAASGSYNVTLVVKTTDGCVDSVSKAVAVFDVPTGSFTATTECAGTATTFTNTSTITTGTLSYNWAFGDGGTSTDINPTHTYLADGNYNVTLTATSNNGCVDDTIITVVVNEQPVSSFTIADASVCLGDSIEFTNTSGLSNAMLTWAFGDGNTSNDVDPTYLYTAPGVYTVTLTVQDTTSGCTDESTATVTIFDEPIAFFTATSVCEGNTTEFTNGSFIPTGVLSFVWDLGDGNTSTDINPTHTYATAGDYDVFLTATSDNGCTDTVTVTVTVNPEPTSAFTIVDASVCFGDTVFFTDGSTAGVDVTYAWDFGDGNTSTETDPAHLYAGPGVYDVTLALLDTITGCTDTSYGQATVFDEPVAGFTATTVCEGSTTAFTNTTTIGTGTLSFVWDFADGSSSTDINPTHTYAAAGDYDVLLTATSNNGCVDTITVTVTVNPEPVSAFTIADASVCDGDTVFFTDGSTSVGSDITYTWDFGDGNTSIDASPAYLYAGPGLYDVFLALTDTVTGCTDTAFAQVTVFDEPVAAFVGKDVCLGDPTVFTNNSTIGTGTLSYAWDFADGASSTDINPTHTYAAAGDYDVILTVTSNNGCTDSDTVTVTVNPEPTSDFTAVDSTVCFGDVVEFVNNSSTGGDFGYSWNFGDGNTSTDDNPTHLYAGPGLYNVVLAVTDTITGCTDTSDMLIEVYHEPVAGFTASDICIGETVQFTSTATLGVGTLSYAWDFGDGNSSTDINPAHTYDSIGIKTITLVVTTDNGCTDTAVNTLIVYPEPVADFSAGPACFGFAVDFTNLTTIDFGTSTYVWEFGDGARDTAANPSHVYPALGVYTVKLTATSDAGCTHYTTQTVQINPNPSAAFSATTVCEGDATEFTNTSSIPSGTITSFWDFGNGFTSLDDAPVYTYPFPGDYDVTLVITSNHGCTDTIVHTITVIPNPDADFLADPVCYGYEVDFTNVSSTSTGGGTIVDVKWFFGDGAVSLEANPSHLYDAPGSYLAQLIVTSSTGCIDTISKAVVVHELPDSTIRPLGPTEFCDGDSVELSAAGGLSYLWSTGETTRNITVKESGDYCVTVTTAFGCVADSCIAVTKWELPIAYAGEDTAVSKGYLAYLHATGGVEYEWTPSDVLNNAFIADPTARPLETTQFIVLVTDTNGCQNTDSMTVFVKNDYLVEATNLITPNQDGKNDRWIIINIETYPDVEVLIFDRWGTQVYSSKAYDNSWDGTYEGNDLPEGTYYYVLRFDGSERTYKGAINILR